MASRTEGAGSPPSRYAAKVATSWRQAARRAAASSCGLGATKSIQKKGEWPAAHARAPAAGSRQEAGGTAACPLAEADAAGAALALTVGRARSSELSSGQAG